MVDLNIHTNLVPNGIIISTKTIQKNRWESRLKYIYRNHARTPKAGPHAPPHKFPQTTLWNDPDKEMREFISRIVIIIILPSQGRGKGGGRKGSYPPSFESNHGRHLSCPPVFMTRNLSSSEQAASNRRTHWWMEIVAFGDHWVHRLCPRPRYFPRRCTIKTNAKGNYS